MRERKNKSVFVISRIIPAPKDLVYKVWTKPELVSQWWGEKGIEITPLRMNVEVDGILHYKMCAADGHTCYGKKVYREIIPNQKIVYVSSFADENMVVVKHPLVENSPLNLLTNVTFGQRNDETMIRVECTPINPNNEEKAVFEKNHEIMRDYWCTALGKLDEYLKKHK